MMTDAADLAASTTARAPRRWPFAVVVIVFALLYAWDVWEAIENVIVVPGSFSAVLLPVPWTALIAGLVVPPVVFVLALVLGRRRSTAERAGLLIAGLCLVAVLTLTLTAYVRAGGL